jgi:hypothetical protein
MLAVAVDESESDELEVGESSVEQNLGIETGRDNNRVREHLLERRESKSVFHDMAVGQDSLWYFGESTLVGVESKHLIGAKVASESSYQGIRSRVGRSTNQYVCVAVSRNDLNDSFDQGFGFAGTGRARNQVWNSSA